MKMGDITKKLLQMQAKLEVPKNQYNSFGKYKYRSCEDILKAARPLCNDAGLILSLNDNIEPIGVRFYVKATATVTDAETGEQFTTTAYAREEEVKKGMDASQITGAASSYARKYALCALFAIDDGQDADSLNKEGAAKEQKKEQKAGYSHEETLKAKALQDLQAFQKESGITNEQISAVIKFKFKKDKWSALNVTEAKALSDNIIEYLVEMEGKNE